MYLMYLRVNYYIYIYTNKALQVKFLETINSKLIKRVYWENSILFFRHFVLKISLFIIYSNCCLGILYLHFHCWNYFTVNTLKLVESRLNWLEIFWTTYGVSHLIIITKYLNIIIGIYDYFITYLKYLTSLMLLSAIFHWLQSNFIKI